MRRRWRRRDLTRPVKDEPRMNDGIRARSVRTVDQDGEQLGILDIAEALRIAEQRDLDLVEVASTSDPPVCRIMDYGRYKYQQEKKQQESRKHQTVIQVKEIKFRPKTSVHDYEFKVKHIQTFLEKGNKVKVTIMFRGREIVHSNIGRQILERVAEDVAELGIVEAQSKLEGRNMSMMLTPGKAKK
ncbi:MAG: translation initiation factor IF-3 [Candidatus Alcyoniella australis]|nr:translation initiation factor IF-3 [Candidatus Alcyoniella australis]